MSNATCRAQNLEIIEFFLKNMVGVVSTSGVILIRWFCINVHKWIIIGFRRLQQITELQNGHDIASACLSWIYLSDLSHCYWCCFLVLWVMFFKSCLEEFHQSHCFGKDCNPYIFIQTSMSMQTIFLFFSPIEQTMTQELATIDFVNHDFGFS